MSEKREEIHPIGAALRARIQSNSGGFRGEDASWLTGELQRIRSGELGWALFSVAQIGAALDAAGQRPLAEVLLQIATSFSPELTQETAMLEEENARRSARDTDQLIGRGRTLAAKRVGQAPPKDGIPIDRLIRLNRRA